MYVLLKLLHRQHIANVIVTISIKYFVIKQLTF